MFQWTPIKNKIKTNEFELPLELNEYLDYVIPENSKIHIILDSYQYLNEIWNIIKQRKDILFYMPVYNNIEFPNDWNEGYKNVVLEFYISNQKDYNEKINAIIKQKALNKIINIKMQEEIMINEEIRNSDIQAIYIYGDPSGKHSCNFDSVKKIQEKCKEYDINFQFKTTGKIFQINNKKYQIKEEQQENQAKLSNINYISKRKKISNYKHSICNQCNKIAFCKLGNTICNKINKEKK